MTTKLRLSYRERSELLQQWAQMEAAGIDAVHVADTLMVGASAKLRLPMAHMRKQLAAGLSPASAGRAVGIFSNWEARIVQAAFETGRMQAGLRMLAAEFSARAQRLQRLKSNLALPGLVFAMASLLAPLPALFAGAVSGGGFLFRALLPPLVVVGGVWTILRMMQAPAGMSTAMASMVIRLPLLGQLVSLRCRHDYLNVLAMALRAGIPALAAMPLAAGAVNNPYLAAVFSCATRCVEDGDTVADALQRTHIFADASGYALVSAGEHAGSLDDMLTRYACSLDARANRLADQLAEWTPRLIYCAVALYILYRVIGFWDGRVPAE